MEVWLWAIINCLVVIIIILSIRIHLMRKSADEIRKEFADRLKTDTNVLIGISSHDKKMKHLAGDINQQLRKLRKEQLRYQQGNTELQDAITNISHDLRTPLTAMYGYLELLKKEEQTEDSMRYINRIEERADALKELIEELFEYTVLSSQGEEKKQQILVNAVLEESIASFYGVLKQHSIQPEIHITEHRVERWMNRSALLRIFENIIGNAIKYSEGDLYISLTDNGAITISNTAKELNSVMAGKLFDRFFTVQTGRNSTGIGLSIAKLLTEQEVGTIRADYNDEKLSIYICFPKVIGKAF